MNAVGFGNLCSKGDKLDLLVSIPLEDPDFVFEKNPVYHLMSVDILVVFAAYSLPGLGDRYVHPRFHLTCEKQHA